MKKFDLEAAKKGARVCTMDGQPVRILCYDLKHRLYPIVAAITDSDGTEWIRRYTIKGEFTGGEDGKHDLMMADDDYLEKLERGEYHSIKEYTPYLYDASNDVWQQPHIIMGPEAPVWQEPHRIMTPKDTAKVTFLSPFDESYWRKQYAGMAMQGLCAANGTMKPASMVADVAVEYADALVEKLEKEKE